MKCSLKGCDTSRVSQAFSLEDHSCRLPGAMPQAMLSQPFGLKATHERVDVAVPSEKRGPIVSIGMCVRYRDPSREEEYWPYLTQRHLRDCLWPLASVLGLERVELLEVLCVYESADDLRELLAQMDAVLRYFDDPANVKEQYPEWEHVRNRTAELSQRLQQVLAEWSSVEEVTFC